jgi:Condensation domain
MTRSDIEIGTQGATLGSLADGATGVLVRPLGAFERMYQRYQQKNTMHHCIVAELAGDLEPSALEAGLDAVQHRHPLLNVHVEDHPQRRLGFYRPATVPPIPVTVAAARPGRTWRDLVADELTRPFDTARTPMIRAVLLRAGPDTPAAIILTAAHVIIDGMSAVYILRDLFSALNGHQLKALPVPSSQEEMLGRLRDAQPPAAAPAAQPAEPEWMATLGTIRPFDGAVPDLSTVSFSEDLTRRLAARARAEQTTVHSALVAAMTRVIIESGRSESVRMLTPINFRSQIGVDDGVCDYFTATRTAFTRKQLTSLWEMARTVSGQLAGPRSVPSLLGGSAATEQFMTADVTHAEAEAFMVAGLSFEAFASNLGVLDMGTPEAVRPAAIWGPAILMQVTGELATGVCTFDGQLRTVCASHEPLPGYLDRVRDVLDTAC